MKYSGFLFAFLIPFILSAQKNFQPGYVVTLKGDTVKGFIDYKEWNFTPTSILFKLSGNNSDQKEYTVSDLSFFQITGKEAYRRFIVKISLHQAKLDNIGGRDTSRKTDTVFLKVLYPGKLSLFSYEDKIKERFYILEERMGQPEELVLREYIKAGSMSLVSENIYKDQLKAIMYAMNRFSDDLSSRIEEAAYGIRDLKKIVQLLNKGNGKELASEEKSHSSWFAGIGLQRDNLSFEGQHFFADDATNTSLSWLPKISGGLDLFVNPNVEKLFFRLEAGFQLNKSNISLVNWNKARTYELASSTVSILPQVNYTLYNTPKLKIPAGVGLSYNLMMYSKNQYKELSPSGDEVYGQNDSFLELKKGILSFLAHASVVFNNKIEASFLYRPSTSFTKYRAYSLGGSNMQLQVYYLFRTKR
jgi:hypothetical protein